MIDELAVKRMKRCAQSNEGHTFTKETHGTCTRCGIVVRPRIEE